MGSGCRRSTRTGAARPETARRRHPLDIGSEHPGRIQRLPDDGSPVRLVPRQRLPGPVPGDQDAAPAAAEVFTIMGFRAAPASGEAGSGLVGLDAVAEPVRGARGEQGSQRTVRPHPGLEPRKQLQRPYDLPPTNARRSSVTTDSKSAYNDGASMIDTVDLTAAQRPRTITHSVIRRVDQDGRPGAHTLGPHPRHQGRRWTGPSPTLVRCRHRGRRRGSFAYRPGAVAA